VAAACGRSEPASVSSSRKVLPLRPGAAVVLAGGEAHSYRIAAPAGTFVQIGVEQRGIDVAARLLDPSGREMTLVDSPTGPHGTEPLPLVVDVAGFPWLEVQAAAGHGAYAVRIEARRPATEQDRALVAAERAFAQAEARRRTGDGESLRAALARYREVLPRFHALGDRPREVDVLDRMGVVHQALGEADRALVVYRQAAELARGLEDRQRAWRALCGVGIAHRTRGEPELALQRFREALALRPEEDPSAEAGTWDLMGRAYASLGEVEGALDAYQRARAIWQRLGSRGDEGATLANLGRLYAFLGDDRQALAALEQALPRLEAESRERDLDGVLVDLGALHRDAGRVELALQPLRRARQGYLRAGNRRGEAVALNEIGRLHQSAGRRAAAREAYREALAFFHEQGYRHDEAVVLANLGRLFADVGESGQARAAFSRSLLLFQASGNRLGAATAWHGLARVRRTDGDLAGALEESGRALAAIEDMRREPLSLDLRSSFFASRQEAYELHVAILLDLHRRDPRGGHAIRALETVERARARSFLDALARAEPLTPRPPDPARLPEIQAQLAADTVLLEYSLGTERSWLFALTPASAAVFPLPPRARIEGLARQVHGLLAAGDATLGRGAADAALADLSNLLLSPVADRLQGRRVLLVPDGALHSVPFAALPLLSGLEISSLPSASSLVALRRATAGRKPAPGAVAVLADPVFDGRDPRFPPLPHSRAEAEAILALVPASQSLAALGPAASRATVESGALARYRIVHFATHGVLDPERPERSGVMLSDGFLAARDLFRLHLPAELVVLSACQTALGREMPGEGVVGLTRPFFYAGARRVLVSLWPVEDEATAELMRRFYEALLRGGRTPATPAEALRDAQESMRREPAWESPFYWAGFVLQGEP
jgi:tetratricopeptide (TPR) repeat protein